MMRGRSMCSNCKHPLAAVDLVPIFSWIFLRGKCRYCHKKIEDSPLVEVSTALLFVISYIFWPHSVLGTQHSVLFLVWLAILVGFVALIVYDLRWMILPNQIVAVLAGLALLQLAIRMLQPGGIGVFTAAFWGVVCIAGLFYGLFVVSKEQWIGGGDVKLGVVLGILVGGPMAAVLVIFLASLLGTLASIPMLLKQKKNLKMRIPFGPFLIAATIFTYLFGTQLMNWLNAEVLYL